MATVSTKTIIMFLLISTLVLSTTAMMSGGRRLAQATSKLECGTVYGTQGGDTCTSVAGQFGLKLKDFLTINPNINCATIFVGQWLCTALA